jgi:hypothetical protein
VYPSNNPHKGRGARRNIDPVARRGEVTRECCKDNEPRIEQAATCIRNAAILDLLRHVHTCVQKDPKVVYAHCFQYHFSGIFLILNAVAITLTVIIAS